VKTIVQSLYDIDYIL